MARYRTEFNPATGRPKFLQMCSYCNEKKGWSSWTEEGGYKCIDCFQKFVMDNPDIFKAYHKKLAKKAKACARRILLKRKQNPS